jgi:hypothetical protein
MSKQKILNGLKAYSMNEYMNDMYEEFEDEDLAECFMNEWLAYGVPDGSTVEDCIIDFGEMANFNELKDDFIAICRNYDIKPQGYKNYFEKNLEKYDKMLDKDYDI